jgi:hypothetical protein
VTAIDGTGTESAGPVDVVGATGVLRSALAPSVAALRPARESPLTEGFPVYPDLPAVLRTAPDPPGHVTAWRPGHVLATASAYAYGDAQTMATIMARMGLLGCRVVTVSSDVDAMLISGTAHVVQSADGATVIVAYRGTRPTGVIDLLGDLDVSPTRLRVPLGGEPVEVHAGWYRNVRATRADVIGLLDRARQGHDITSPVDAPRRLEHGTRDLYLTGHSLGGAMAALMTVLLAAERDPRRREIAAALCAVHTIGQPMVGTPEFARRAAALPWPGQAIAGAGDTVGERLVRWVHRDDVVARYPPFASGDYAHVGRELRFRDGAGWRESAPSRQLWGATWIALSPLSVLAGTTRLTRSIWRGPSLDDHLPEHYVERLAPEGTVSEFGD